eukprot:3968081-Amphidinium_carterae.1
METQIARRAGERFQASARRCGTVLEQTTCGRQGRSGAAGNSNQDALAAVQSKKRSEQSCWRRPGNSLTRWTRKPNLAEKTCGVLVLQQLTALRTTSIAMVTDGELHC